MAEEAEKKVDLRSLALGGGRPKFEIVTWNGGTFEVRAPTLKQQQTLTKRSTDKDGKQDFTALLAWSVIECVWDPKEGTKVFGHKDIEAVMELGMNDFLGPFAEALKKVSTKSEEDLEKNSVTAPTE